MKLDALVAEIGSTTTVVNAFDGLDTKAPRFLAQGQARTTVEEGDVSVGLELALDDLRKQLGTRDLSWRQFLASSSAAGGLRMTVHGLVYDMTVRAARETCLGSGGVIKFVTAGKLRRTDLKTIGELRPNMMFLAGGTDYGERETALYNAERLLEKFPDIPMIYAGNTANREEIEEMAKEAGARLRITENVYPSLDEINTEPARLLIHKVFEENIVHSPGMEKIRNLVDGPILPTPGAVMEAAILAREAMGDVLVLDIGGATTDVHSVTDGNPNNVDFLMEAEPTAKRTVEGDLGVFVNRWHLLNRFTDDERLHQLQGAEAILEKLEKIPRRPEEIALVERFTQRAAEIALERHAGKWIQIFSATGPKSFLKGKDLSAVQTVIGTGGALTRLPRGRKILESLLGRKGEKLLLPSAEARVLLDHHYIMASLGVLSKTWPEAALQLLRQSCDAGKE